MEDNLISKEMLGHADNIFLTVGKIFRGKKSYLICVCLAAVWEVYVIKMIQIDENHAVDYWEKAIDVNSGLLVCDATVA